MISHRHCTIFIHIPKTAGTSIEQKLGLFDVLSRGIQDHRSIREIRPLSLTTVSHALFSGPRSLPGIGRRTILREMLGISPRNGGISKGEYLGRTVLKELVGLSKRPGQYGQRATKKEFESYFKFSVVRNPWARVYSWYKNVIRDPFFCISDCDFGTFLRDYSGNWALQPQTHWLTDFDGTIPLNRIVKYENLVDEMTEVLSDLGFSDRSLPHLLKRESGPDYRAAYSDDLAEMIGKRYAHEIKLFGYKF